MGGIFSLSEKKPPSNPKNWPLSIPSEIAARPQRIIKVGENQDFSFCTNFVKTVKYDTFLHFLIKFLFFEEFHPRFKFANCYFLAISALQCIGPISNTQGVPTYLLPLSVVVLVDALFAWFEDKARDRADSLANASKAYRYNSVTKLFEECQWWEVSVGDYVRVDSREQSPADILILNVAEKDANAPRGIFYVETKSLDGETNLKIRSALPNTMREIANENDLNGLRGDIEMEHPNNLIDSFNGIADFGELGREPIQSNNVLLRGCVLRNIDWVCGIVVNTGHDTKIMMSSMTTKSKSSNLEAETSTETIRILMLLIFLCICGATGQTVWNQENNVGSFWYLDYNPEPVGNWFISFFYFFLLHATFIPVSLYVSMAMVRSVQAHLMQSDLDMYYEETDTPAIVRTMTLNEELGQVSHIFTDKTGTLTCNIMDFRKASINGVAYGLGITEIGRAAWKLQGKAISQGILDGEAKAQALAQPHVSFYCPKYERDVQTGGPQKEKIEQFFKILSVCHDVIPEKVNGRLNLSASNPDDEALVYAARYFGFSFIDRRDKLAIIATKVKGMDRELEIEILHVIKFTSLRKRMSVVVRDFDGKVKIFTKGADSIMLPRMREGQKDLAHRTQEHINDYSIEGLRCLVLGQNEIPEAEYKKWSAAYRAATSDLVEITKQKNGEDNLIEELEDQIEQGLYVVGATAIEDKLQDGVPECIANLAKAGINLWVLTGDKEETAINIAVACNMILPQEYMDHIIINPDVAATKEEIKDIFITEIKRYDTEVSGGNDDVVQMKPRALIIDGPTLITCMADLEDDGLKELLLEMSQRCKAVVGCRVSPDQKREMVSLIKDGIPGVRTLAIGDGANDVAMIQEAHIGVGIKGEEGVQAVNSADYAIAQFRYLSDLTLKHGRYNYIRMSYVVSYTFYKNVLMSIAQFWFNFSCAFSGQKYYTEIAIQSFNVLLSFIPIILLGVYDIDISKRTVLRFPQLYQSGINDEYFNSQAFWSWILTGILESTFLSALPLYSLSSDQSGTITTFLQAGATTFTAIVFVVNIKLFFIQCRWYWFSFVGIFVCFGLYFAMMYLWSSSYGYPSEFYDFYYVWQSLMGQSSFWLTTLVLVTTVTMKDIYMNGLERNFNFRPIHVLQEIELFGPNKDGSYNYFNLSAVTGFLGGGGENEEEEEEYSNSRSRVLPMSSSEAY